jgi:hypothetical protein
MKSILLVFYFILHTISLFAQHILIEDDNYKHSNVMENKILSTFLKKMGFIFAIKKRKINAQGNTLLRQAIPFPIKIRKKKKQNQTIRISLINASLD